MEQHSIKAFWLFVTLGIFSGCAEPAGRNTLFQLLDTETTGVDFVNRIQENEDYNLYDYEYMYNGGGVGILDINNDGLQDILLGGNMVSSRLYLNKGNFKFEDITASSGLTTSRWITGISVVDINKDGFQDIYMCVGGNRKVSNTANLLFLNNQNNTFTEAGDEYGIADTSLTTQAAFLDYDLDGDLDLYLLNFGNVRWAKDVIYKKIKDGSGPGAHRFYRNNGDGTFEDVTAAAGVLIEGYGLGVAVLDFNHDHYPDIYVSNDYLDDDILYINNGKGGFEDRITSYIKHTSYFAMGTDFGDINNDGLEDLVTVDMLPEINERHKLFVGAGSYDKVRLRSVNGFMNAYMRNTLQINNGDQTFSETGQFSGIAETDWSWGPLLADFDNDGYKDLFITNGYKKEITNLDISIKINLANIVTGNEVKTVSNESVDKERGRFLAALSDMEENKLLNYCYRNNGNMTFGNAGPGWGIDIPTFSSGSAYADLDNDGDLDLVVNNINDPVFIYRNTASENPANHYLNVKVLGPSGDVNAFGATVKLYSSGHVQAATISPVRGFQSSSGNILHFGLGAALKADSLTVEWNGGEFGVLKNVNANQTLIVRYEDVNKEMHGGDVPSRKNFAATTPLDWSHRENEYVDFKYVQTLPRMLSREGPAVAAGDVNGDGIADFVLGGARDQNTALGLSDKHGYAMKEIEKEYAYEDAGVLLFDADNDGDLDLYLASGGVENFPGSVEYIDRFYVNDGKGNFHSSPGSVPQLNTSKSCIAAADYDNDGDLDLFVGGRVTPGTYPLPVSSFILENEGGSFKNVTLQVCPDLAEAGLVTGALWSDFDNDGKTDLIVVGEWMPLTFFRNNGRSLVNVTGSSGIATFKGWWNSINGGDFDNDGDTDYIAGNFGLNHRYNASADTPLSIYAKDIDSNGSIDPIVFCYEDGVQYPIHARDELIGKIAPLRKKFYSYSDYAKASLKDLVGRDASSFYAASVTTFASAHIENLGGGKFRMIPLPDEAQTAPVYGIKTMDINDDNALDVVLIGNTNATTVNDGNIDALNGLVLVNDSKGGFEAVKSNLSGFRVSGYGKALVSFVDANGKLSLLAGQNNDRIVAHELQGGTHKILKLAPEEHSAELIFVDGGKRKVELYQGEGCLSQSERYLQVPASTEVVIIYSLKGRVRKVSPDQINL